MAQVGGSSQHGSQQGFSKTQDLWGIKDMLMGSGANSLGASVGNARDFLNSVLTSANNPDQDTAFNRAADLRFNRALAGSQSGPQFQSMGAARQGAAQGAALEGANYDTVSQALDAAKGQEATALGAAGVAAPYQGTNTKGSSSQSGMQGSAGITCCFIFLEALNGELPWYVRKARDTRGSTWTVKGYRWMSRWLVPAMRTSRIARWLVNTLMVRPMLCSGDSRYVHWTLGGEMCRPVVLFWFTLWTAIGITLGHHERGRD